MNFIIDAQLPRRLVRVLQHAGHDAIHTLDLPAKNRTPDKEIIHIAESTDRIVVTKDADFVETFILYQRPPKLLVITTGNISNPKLEALFVAFIPAIITAFATNNYVELSRTTLIVHL